MSILAALHQDVNLTEEADAPSCNTSGLAPPRCLLGQLGRGGFANPPPAHEKYDGTKSSVRKRNAVGMLQRAAHDLAIYPCCPALLKIGDLIQLQESFARQSGDLGIALMKKTENVRNRL